MLTTGEIFSARRLLTDEVKGCEMEGVEHLGQYVFEMTQAKVEMLKNGESALPPKEAGVSILEDEETEIDAEGGEVKVQEEPDESELDEIT